MVQYAAKFSLGELQSGAEKEALALGYNPRECVFSVRVTQDGQLFLLIEHIRATEGDHTEICSLGEHIISLF